MSEQGPITKSGSLWENAADRQEERLRALYTAADPQGEPSEALRRQISALAVRHAASPLSTPVRRPVLGLLTGFFPLRARVPSWAPRACVAALLVALLVGIRPTSSPEGGVLAAVLRASVAAPALHVVGRGPHETQELWYLAGVGCYLYGKNPKSEAILVDDRKRYYRYEIREGRVYVGDSVLADPKGVALFWENHSGTGMLKQWLEVAGPENVSVETVIQGGRTLRQIVGPRRVTRITIDPETDRILTVETGEPQAGSTNAPTRYEFSYPDPATVDRRHFRFVPPPGVPVVDQTTRQ